MEKSKVNKSEEPLFNAYAIVKGASAIQYRLIRLKMKGKALDEVEVVIEEILPVIISKVEQLLRQEGLQC